MQQLNSDRNTKNSLLKILTAFGSFVSIGFGIWHFFVPGIWNWYTYIDPAATELVIAVRAINIFFSLLLVLLGIANLLVVFRKFPDRFSTMVIIAVSTILWAARLILQIIYPQGSQNPVIQYTMLFVFIIVFACFFLILLYLVSGKNKLR